MNTVSRIASGTSSTRRKRDLGSSQETASPIAIAADDTDYEVVKRLGRGQRAGNKHCHEATL